LRYGTTTGAPAWAGVHQPWHTALVTKQSLILMTTFTYFKKIADNKANKGADNSKCDKPPIVGQL
jgi:hypothetical protein